MPRIRVVRKVAYAKEASLTRAQVTALELFTLPSGAIPVRVSVFTAAAAVGGTLDVGILGNTDAYIDGMDISGLGMSIGTLLDIDETDTPTAIYALIATAPGAGGPFTVIFANSRDMPEATEAKTRCKASSTFEFAVERSSACLNRYSFSSRPRLWADS